MNSPRIVSIRKISALSSILIRSAWLARPCRARHPFHVTVRPRRAPRARSRTYAEGIECRKRALGGAALRGHASAQGCERLGAFGGELDRTLEGLAREPACRGLVEAELHAAARGPR